MKRSGDIIIGSQYYTAYQDKVIGTICDNKFRCYLMSNVVGSFKDGSTVFLKSHTFKLYVHFKEIYCISKLLVTISYEPSIFVRLLLS